MVIFLLKLLQKALRGRRDADCQGLLWHHELHEQLARQGTHRLLDPRIGHVICPNLARDHIRARGVEIRHDESPDKMPGRGRQENQADFEPLL